MYIEQTLMVGASVPMVLLYLYMLAMVYLSNELFTSRSLWIPGSFPPFILIFLLLVA